MRIHPLSLLGSILIASLVAAAAFGDDAALRRDVRGTWIDEQNAGVASVGMFTTCRDDGTAIQLIKTMFVFKRAKGVCAGNRWRIGNGNPVLTPLRHRAHDSCAKIEMTEATRSQLRLSGDEFAYQLKGGERTESRVTRVPDDVQAMIDELSEP